MTHDQAEAMTLCHRVAVLKDAQLQRCDTPRALFDRPVNTFVAGFVGSPAMNLCPVPLGANGSITFGGTRIELPPDARDGVVVGVRPDGLAATVEVVEELGCDAYLFCGAELDDGPARLVARVEARHAPARGARVHLRPDPEFEPHLFDAATGRRLGVRFSSSGRSRRACCAFASVCEVKAQQPCRDDSDPPLDARC